MDDRKIKIYDLNSYELSDRNGMYGGMAGLKEGIVFENENWLVKYPKSTRYMKANDISYTTSPLSEFIGSHIYDILGYDVHETILGERNNKIVVCCKDFCKDNIELREIRTLKNIYNEQLEEILETELHETSSSHQVDLRELLIHFDVNPVLSKVEGLKERFWDCVIIDGFIKNNDRNNGNWGLLYQNKKYSLAPVFDNGAAFSNKTSDEQMKNLLISDEKMDNTSLNVITAYGVDGNHMNLKKILNMDIPELQQAVIRVVPKIQEKLPEIRTMIEKIPDQYKNFLVCSDVRKQFYVKGMEIRLNKLLLPTYYQFLVQNKSINDRQKENGKKKTDKGIVR